MADDYLGKKMEDYQRSRGALRTAPTHRGSSASSAVKREGYIKNPFEPMRILVDDGLCQLGRKIVTTMRAVGCRVAFIGVDSVEGSRLAQTTGARFYPGADIDTAIADLTARWGSVDVVIRASEADGARPLNVTITNYDEAR